MIARLAAVALLGFATARFCPQPADASQPRSHPDLLDYDQVPVGLVSCLEVAVVNDGPDSVFVDTAFVFVDTALVEGAFDLILPPPLLIGTSDSVWVAVRFSPASAGVDSALLIIVSRSGTPDGPDSTEVRLHGIGTDVVIDEVLADPGSGDAGDANGDGIRQTYADEFVELLNNGLETVDLTGWRLGDDDAPASAWFTFPPMTALPPGQRLVLFGGGSPSGIGDSAYSDDGRIGNGLSNSGESLWLVDADGDTAASALVGIPWNRNQSVTRYPAGIGPFVQHPDPPADGSLFSPGAARTIVDSVVVAPADTAVIRGRSLQLTAFVHWSNGTIEQRPVEWTTSAALIADVDADGIVRALDAGEATMSASFATVTSSPALVQVLPEPESARCVVISEILADPPSGTVGDANGDGERRTYEDEFIELFNAGADTVSIAGWTLGDDDVAVDGLFRFPDDARLAPGSYVVLFGGGNPQGLAGRAYADDGRIGNGLTNSGDTVVLRHALGDTIDLHSGTDWPQNVSIVRWPEDCKRTAAGPPCQFAAHDSPPGTGQPFSAGASRPTATAPADTPNSIPPRLSVTEILADPPSGPKGDANGDGVTDRFEDEFIEIFNDGDAVDVSGWRLSDDDTAVSRQFRFPQGTVLQPRQYVVLFGGGEPGVSGRIFVDDGRLGNGLTNSGDRLLLIAPAPIDTILDVTYTSRSNIDQSLTIDIEDGELVPHNRLPGRTIFSPGRARPTYADFTIDTVDVILGEEPEAPPVRGVWADSTELIPPSLITWVSYDSEIASFESLTRPVPHSPGIARIAAWNDKLFLAEGLLRVRRPRNLPPAIISAPDSDAYAGGHYHYQVGAVDPEDGTLMYIMAQSPEWLRIDLASGLMSGRVPDTPGNVIPVAFEVSDGHRWVSQQYELRIVAKPRLRITEILMDPPRGHPGDANGDGVRQTYGDEFVELYNLEEFSLGVGGWRLSDGDVSESRQFRFPAGTVLPPRSYCVVFGGGSPSGALSFVDDGRIGDGLGNRSDEVYLIDAEGPDTLAVARYALDREPNQSIQYSSDRSLAPIPHSTFPGRDLFSPGVERALLNKARILPRRTDAVAGERTSLRVVGHYSDGVESDITRLSARTERGSVAKLSWRSSNPAAAVVDCLGTVTAVGVGRSLIEARLEGAPTRSFAVRPAVVNVGQRLADLVSFKPGWQRSTVARGRNILFSVEKSDPVDTRVRWSVNGRIIHGAGESRFAFARATGSHARRSSFDTVAVRVSSRPGVFGRSERVTREWILGDNSPPIVLSPTDTVAVAGEHFTMVVRAVDVDGDRLYFLLDRGPAGLRLDPRNGGISWRPAAADSGPVEVRIAVLDGFVSVIHACTINLAPAAKSVAAFVSVPMSYPNPSNDSTTISFFLSGQPTPPVAEVRLFDIVGRPVRTLIQDRVTSGLGRVLWDGRDEAGRTTASGAYVYAIRAGSLPPITGRLLRVR